MGRVGKPNARVPGHDKYPHLNTVSHVVNASLETNDKVMTKTHQVTYQTSSVLFECGNMVLPIAENQAARISVLV